MITPEQQRIAIAEACGYVKKAVKYDFMGESGSVDVWNRYKPDGTIDGGMPDYLNDLNAMHEAEKTLDIEKHKNSFIVHFPSRLYQYYLISISNGKLEQAFEPTREEYLTSALATAPQRAEAFLRTIGKWKD